MFGLREYFQMCASGFAGMSHHEVLRIRQLGAKVVTLAAQQDIPKATVGVNAAQMYPNESGRNFMAVFVAAGQHFAVVRGGGVTLDDYQNFGAEAIRLGIPALRSSHLYHPLTGDFLGRASDVFEACRQIQVASGRSKLQLIQSGQGEKVSLLTSQFAAVRHKEHSEIDARYMTVQMFTLHLRKVMQDLYDNEFSFDLLTSRNDTISLRDFGLEDMSL